VRNETSHDLSWFGLSHFSSLTTTHSSPQHQVPPIKDTPRLLTTHTAQQRRVAPIGDTWHPTPGTQRPETTHEEGSTTTRKVCDNEEGSTTTMRILGFELNPNISHPTPASRTSRGCKDEGSPNVSHISKTPTRRTAQRCIDANSQHFKPTRRNHTTA
jgi:hypothetical protein